MEPAPASFEDLKNMADQLERDASATRRKCMDSATPNTQTKQSFYSPSRSWRENVYGKFFKLLQLGLCGDIRIQDEVSAFGCEPEKGPEDAAAMIHEALSVEKGVSGRIGGSPQYLYQLIESLGVIQR